MPLYRCSRCKKIVERDGRARSIRSFCETVGRWVKIRKVKKRRRKTGLPVIEKKVGAYCRQSTPEQVVKELEALGVEFSYRYYIPEKDLPEGLLR